MEKRWAPAIMLIIIINEVIGEKQFFYLPTLWYNPHFVNYHFSLVMRKPVFWVLDQVDDTNLAAQLQNMAKGFGSRGVV